MADIADRPEVASHWRERIIRTARMIARDEMTRRPDLVRAWVEVEGAWTFTLDDGSAFTLNGRVDRVDLQSDGRLAITDYKSGTVPATKDVASGWAPQLPLSALLAKGGFLAGVPAKPVTRLLYWKIGTRETPLKNVAEDDIDALLATTEEGLRKLLGAYRDKAQAYPSAPFPERQPGYSEYDDLARRDPPPDGWRR
jgi:ATP-dependent helicase/nuclease subunit B